MLRPLRIAVSVVSGICCVLVIVLWVRSYWWYDTLAVNYGHASVDVSSIRGYLDGSKEEHTTQLAFDWGLITHSAHEESNNYFMFIRPQLERTTQYHASYWCVTLVWMVATILAAFPWLRWQFSLRTLLLATTAIAVLLGLVIYATRG